MGKLKFIEQIASTIYDTNESCWSADCSECQYSSEANEKPRCGEWLQACAVYDIVVAPLVAEIERLKEEIKFLDDAGTIRERMAQWYEWNEKIKNQTLVELPCIVVREGNKLYRTEYQVVSVEPITHNVFVDRVYYERTAKRRIKVIKEMEEEYRNGNSEFGQYEPPRIIHDTLWDGKKI